MLLTGPFDKILTVCLLPILAVNHLSAQNIEASPKSALEPYVEYANTSSHILLGTAFNRRVAAAGLEYTHGLRHRKSYTWTYIVDMRPIVFLQDPVSTTTQTVQFGSNKPYGPFLVQDGPIQQTCQSAIIREPIDAYPPQAVVVTRVCGKRWTYAGGISPLGQQIAFFPTHRLQPFALVNAGFVASTRDLPQYQSSSFNFTFEFGAGVRIMQSSSRGIDLSYRIRHLSNGYLGYNNPGIDNQIVRMSYIIGRH